MKITHKEAYIIEAIASNALSANNYFLPSYKISYEEANLIGGCWASTIDDNGAKHGEISQGKQISGVISSLNKKGYVISRGSDINAVVEITKNGWQAYQQWCIKNL